MDIAELIQNISESKATLKIITKTKNETLFIEKWILHHLAIIGEGKLIIFDNMSNDEHVLRVYEKYKEHILLITFSGYQDRIHSYQQFSLLYNAIRESSHFFTILDSDEYLYLYDEKTNKAVCDTSILEYLKENMDCNFFAPCWLENKEECEDTLLLTSRFASLFGWGKPLINTNIFSLPHIEIYEELLFRHAFELPSLQYTKTKTKFFIAHLKNLDKIQRIRTNMNKLVSKSIVKSNTDIEELLSLNKYVTKSQSQQELIKNTQKLVKSLASKALHESQCSAKEKTLTISQNNEILFSDGVAKHAFISLMSRDYLNLIDYDATTINCLQYPQLLSWIKRKQ